MAINPQEVQPAARLDLLRIDQKTRVRHLQIPSQRLSTRD